jgi:hypothetical protein
MRAAEPHESGSSIVTSIGPTDMKWIIENGGALETQTFYVSLENEAFVFLQVAHSNLV